MENFHFYAAALVVVIPGVLAVVRFLLNEVWEFWLFLQKLRWKRPCTAF